MKTLKTTFKPLIFSLLIGLAFMNCSSDDDAPNVVATQDLIIGKWFFESTTEDFPKNPCEETSFLEFFDDATGNSVLYTETSNGDCIALLAGNLSYEFISESTIKFTNNDADDSTFTSDLISVSNTKLVLKNFAFITGNIEFKKAP